jgi:hypothetical protein
VTNLTNWVKKSREDSLLHLFNISQALGVQKDQCVVWLGGVGQTPHPDALGLRPHSGFEGEACKGRGKTTNIHSRDLAVR